MRDTLHELAVGGLVTSDSFAALRLLARWRRLERRADAPDPTRWFSRDDREDEPIVQRRTSIRRIPRWRRPEAAGSDPDHWPGRWSLVHSAGLLGPERDEEELAEHVARQWLDRYGIVSREMWRSERPAVPWRAVYREYRTLEMRGDVRRGHFVDGLTGAQFALPQAVEALRAAESGVESHALSAIDPANAYGLPLEPAQRVALGRARSAGTAVVLRDGRPILAGDARSHSLRVDPDASHGEIAAAAEAWVEYVAARSQRPRDLVVESINGSPAMRPPLADVLATAGFRRATRSLRHYRTL
jgi:ATP-dependent Lhr-like helicase